MKKRLSINLNKKSTVELPKVSSGSLIVGVYEGPFTKELKKIDEVINNNYLSNFNIYCLIHEDRKGVGKQLVQPPFYFNMDYDDLVRAFVKEEKKELKTHKN